MLQICATATSTVTPGVDAWAIVDGNKHRRRIVVPVPGTTSFNEGPIDTLGQCHPYTFAAASLTGESVVPWRPDTRSDDDAAVTATEQDIKSLGQIEVEIRRYSALGAFDNNLPSQRQAIRAPATLHECSKKMRSSVSQPR